MPQHVGRRAEHHARRSPLAANDVVGDEAVAAQDQLDRTFALADAALAEKEQADTEHVDEHAVERRRRRELLVEERVERVD